MRSNVARAVALCVLIASLVVGAMTIAVSIAVHDRIEPGSIVVVGNPDTPEMRRVVADLEEAVAHGDTLTANLQVSPGGWVATTLIIVLWIGVGVLIVWRQPGNWAGWLFVITGSALPLLALAQLWVVYDLKAGGSLPFTGVFAWLGEYALYPVALVPLLLLLYPDGHPPSPRWRWAVAGLVGGTALGFLGFLFRPGPFNNWRGDGIVYANPLGIEGFTFGGPIIAIGTVVALVAALSTVPAVVQRYRRSRGEERQQMRVLAFVAAIAGVFFALLLLLIAVGSAFGLAEGQDDWGDALFGIVFGLTAFSVLIGVPVAYLVAIFRYRLWDLDVVIKKALVAVVLTLLMVTAGLLLIGFFGQEALWGETPKAVGIVVGVIAGVLLWPLIRLSRRVARRIVFGRRAAPYEVLSEFSERIGETYASEDVLTRMAQLLAAGTGASSARVLVLVGSDLREEARWPEDAMAGRDEHVVPVVDRGEELGALAVTMPANDPMNPAKDKLVRDLASQAGLVLRNARLIEELRASRQRLVAAQDAERRRLERNIHDGAQQQLVALQVKQRLVEGIIVRDPAKALDLMTQLQTDTAEALEDLRDLARGIYPPLLADKGLGAALESQARKSPVPVTVGSDSLGRYPQEVEAAVYFCALEAMNNLAKYARASSATVLLSQVDGTLTFAVSDDGEGFVPEKGSGGTGLQGMADRLDAIGGSLEVHSAPGEGTTVVGRVPVDRSR